MKRKIPIVNVQELVKIGVVLINLCNRVVKEVESAQNDCNGFDSTVLSTFPVPLRSIGFRRATHRAWRDANSCSKETTIIALQPQTIFSFTRGGSYQSQIVQRSYTTYKDN